MPIHVQLELTTIFTPIVTPIDFHRKVYRIDSPYKLIKTKKLNFLRRKSTSTVLVTGNLAIEQGALQKVSFST